jgi:hypothetical protein
MKYLTKEYERKKYFLPLLDEYQMVEDDLSFEEVYSNYRKEKILQSKKAFDTPQQMMKTREEIIQTYRKENYPKYDLVARRVVGYQSLEEVLQAYDHQKEKLDLQFLNRGEFDQAQVEKRIENQYEESLKEVHNLPYILRKNVDPRFLALRLLPKSDYEKMKNFIKSCQEFCELKEEAYQKEFNSMKENFSNEELSLQSLANLPLVRIVKMEDGYRLLFHFEGLRSRYSTGYDAFDLYKGEVNSKETDILLYDKEDRKTNYPNPFLIMETEYSIQEDKKNLSLLLRRRQDTNLYSEISFSFEEGILKKNI